MFYCFNRCLMSQDFQCCNDEFGTSSLFLVQEDIVAVNQIFKDLGMLVHEQADVIGQFSYSLICLLI